MKNRFALMLIGVVLLAGCAGKKAMNDQATKENAPVVAEQQVPVVTEEATPKAPPGIAPAQEQVATEKAAIEKIYFEFDSYLLTPESRKALVENALWIQTLPELRIVIEGHADERGSDTYNLALGEKRAQAARDYLVTLGIAPERIAIISFGEEKATPGGKSEAAWAQDRRAEFVTSN